MVQNLFTKNFTLLVLGQVSSLFGNIILRFAMSMYVLDVTGSATIFAGILSIATIPTIILSPLGGILADRANRRNIMVALDTLSGISVLYAALLFSTSNDIVIISGLLIMLSIVGAFETPTVQACVPQMQTGNNIIKGNAVINQIAAISSLVAPIFGSILYVAFGLKLIMYASIACFFITSLFECFIKLDYIPLENNEGIISIVKNDLVVSMRFIFKEQPGILKMLLLAALSRFFMMGTAMVGLPFIVRTILGLNAKYYGAAESVLAVATIIGSIAAGLLTGKLKTRKLSTILAAFGVCLIPAGLIFLFPTSAIVKYTVNVISFCGVQIAVTIFSIFAVSFIQQKTPNHLIGKVMAYTATITMCVQPLGQIIYGFLFDSFSNAAYLVIIPTGIIVCIIGVLSMGLFKNLEKE